MDPETGEKEGDGELVPLKAVDEQREAREQERTKREAAERRAADAEGYARGLAAAAPAAPAAPVPKELTAAELQQAVDEQRMTAAEADAIRRRQDDRRVDARIDKRVDDRTETQAVAGRISAELGRYTQAIPDLADRQSASFEKVKNEYAHLISMGHEDNPLTELTAVRTAFGDVAKLEKIGKDQARETHQETGGGREPGAGGAARADGWPKDMSADHRRYYQDQINQGVLKDRAAAVAEFSYQPKHKPRHAA